MKLVRYYALMIVKLVLFNTPHILNAQWEQTKGPNSGTFIQSLPVTQIFLPELKTVSFFLSTTTRAGLSPA